MVSVKWGQLQMDWPTALEQRRALLQREGERLGFSMSSGAFLSYDASRGRYSYMARTSADIRDKAVFTQLSFDNHHTLTSHRRYHLVEEVQGTPGAFVSKVTECLLAYVGQPARCSMLKSASASIQAGLSLRHSM